jgi:HSP20 family protein
LGTVFDQFFREPVFADMSHLMRVQDGLLAVDVSESEKDVIVRASVPGYAKDELDVELHEDVLTIKAEHAEQREESGERWHRRERRRGSFVRRVQLPEGLVEGEVNAELKDGVLTLRLPKSPKSQPRKIPIS